MGLNYDNPFAGKKTRVDVPASSTQPGTFQDNPQEIARRNHIEIKPESLRNIVPSTQG